MFESTRSLFLRDANNKPRVLFRRMKSSHLFIEQIQFHQYLQLNIFRIIFACTQQPGTISFLFPLELKQVVS